MTAADSSASDRSPPAASRDDDVAPPGDVLPVYGQSGTVAGHVAAAEWATRAAAVTLTLADGRHVFIERGKLRDAGGGRLVFGDGHAPEAAPAAPVSPRPKSAAEPPPAPPAPRRQSPATPRLTAGDAAAELEDGHVLTLGQTATFPVVEEQPDVHKRRVERAVVRVHRHVRERQKQIDVPLMSEEVKVERVPADRLVDAMEPPRTEGDVTVIPVYEEVLVVQRKFRVREEIRLTRVQTQRPSHHTVTLRRHEVEIERVAITDGGAKTPHSR